MRVIAVSLVLGDSASAAAARAAEIGGGTVLAPVEWPRPEPERGAQAAGGIPVAGSGCACCRPHHPLVLALRRFDLDHVHGRIPPTDQILIPVIAPGMDSAQIRAAWPAHDPIVAARFRLDRVSGSRLTP